MDRCQKLLIEKIRQKGKISVLVHLYEVKMEVKSLKGLKVQEGLLLLRWK